MRELHRPSACWWGSGTCSVTHSLAYLGVPCWPPADKLIAPQLQFHTWFSESGRATAGFVAQDIGATTQWKPLHPTRNKHPSPTPHHVWFGKLGVINQRCCLLGQGKGKEKPGE